MAPQLDVIIVGASLAGASLALRLLNQGATVALIDKDRFPRRKACGEGLSLAGAQLLEELAVCPPSIRLSGYRILAEARETRLPGSVVGVQRSVLDALLVERVAAHPGAQLLIGEQVRAVRDDSRAVLVSGRWLEARQIVLADGVNSFLAPRLGAERGTGSSRYGLSLMFEGRFERDFKEVTILRRPWGEIFCTPVTDSRLNVALLGQKSLFREYLQIKDSLSAEVAAATGFLGEMCDPPQAVGRVESSRRAALAQGILLIGDCCENLDPVGGMGMTHALGSARLAAEAILAGDLSGYERRRERLAAPLRRLTLLSRVFVQHLSPTPLAGFVRYLFPRLPAISSVAARLPVSEEACIFNDLSCSARGQAQPQESLRKNAE